jgi:hypothetical protein
VIMNISQREARRLRKKVQEFEQKFRAQTDRWIGEWPGSVILHRLPVDKETVAIVKTAKALRHAVVVTMQDDRLVFWGSQP